MGWSGGTFTRTNGTYSGSGVWASDETNAFDIESSRHDAHDQDLATGINACLNKNGQNAMTADLSVGNNKVTSLADGTADSDAVNKGQLDAAVPDGTANGQIFRWDNTGSVWAASDGVLIDDSDQAWLNSGNANGLGVTYFGGVIVNACASSDLATITAALTFQGTGFDAVATTGDATLSATAGRVTLDTNGGESVIVAADGAVGVNVTPAASGRLVVKSDATDTAAFRVQDSTSGNVFTVQENGEVKCQGIGTTSETSPIVYAIGSGNSLQKATSVRASKVDINPYESGLAKAMLLNPVTYRGVNGTRSEPSAGFIAEDVHDAGLTEFVTYDEDGNPDGLDYARITALLAKAVQELSEKVG